MDKRIAKQFLFRVADIIESHGISVFLSDGTCLGAYREKDFIEWDHDMDIKMKAEELIPYLKILSSEFKEESYGTRKIKMNSVWHGIVLRFEGLILDLHGVYLINGKRWRLGNRYKHAYPAEFFENPEQIEFLGRKFYVPTPVKRYLECLYGSDYMTPRKISKGKELEGFRAKEIFGQIEAEDVPRYRILLENET